MKPESLVIADQPRRGEYVPGPCTHRPSRHGSWRDPKPVGQPQGGSRLRSIQDRKSTRLNSSHGYISYAVFCLKKKKAQYITKKKIISPVKRCSQRTRA